MSSVEDWLVLSEPVATALGIGRPVVALETTLVTHGLPPPAGIEMALELEAAVRERGALPATIGVLDGKVRVGLTPGELDRLAAPPTPGKINLSNLSAHLARGERGSTTVATTMLAAHRAGIAVMATGGIGGVHRGVAESADVSADLTALSRMPVAVVCSGAKAVLDLPKTVEWLETAGAPVFGFGTAELPAFYRRESGLPADARFDDVASLARAIATHFRIGTGTGVVVGNPIPMENELDAELYDRGLKAALQAAEKAGVRGRALTPFLLEHMRLETGGESVAANRALLKSNARLAGDLAVALARNLP